jgi:hypothetical protein
MIRRLCRVGALVSKISTNLTNVADGFTNAVGDAQGLDKDGKLGEAIAKSKVCKAL